jgi:hypothetical protein
LITDGPPVAVGITVTEPTTTDVLVAVGVRVGVCVDVAVLICVGV